MAAAVLFGAVHALMPGHGKTVLVSYHLGQPAKLREGVTNGAILALTHVGLALILVLAGFAVISRAFAYGGRTPQFEAASGALIALIGAFLIWRSLDSDHHSHGKDGKTLAFVTGMIPCPLTTFIMSYALARGMLAAGLAVTAAMTLGMIATIGGIARRCRLYARPLHGASRPDRELAPPCGDSVGSGELSAGACVRPLDDAELDLELKQALFPREGAPKRGGGHAHAPRHPLPPCERRRARA